MPESAYRSSLGHNHTPVYLCYLGLLWGCKHRDGNCKDFRATKCERFAIWSFRDDAGKPCPRVLWSWAPSGLGHKLTLVPGRVQVSGLLGEVGVVHVTFPPFPFIFFFYSFNKYLNTSLCQPQLQLLKNSFGEHQVTWQPPTTRRLGGKKNKSKHRLQVSLHGPPKFIIISWPLCNSKVLLGNKIMWSRQKPGWKTR